MGLISPRLPDLDYEEWERKPLMQRIKPMAQDWAEGGFGTPDAVLVLYVVKIALYAFGAAAITSTSTVTSRTTTRPRRRCSRPSTPDWR